MYGPKVDLSFNDITNASGALLVVPRNGQRPLKTNSQGKYLSRSLCLSNNSISNLAGLEHIWEHFLARPWNIGWLDLSFNQITSIDPVVCELHELRVLYLHGNGIWELSEVDKLRELQYLHNITLHGNAIAGNNKYRKHVISTLPQLKMMDFSSVTRDERVLANVCRDWSGRGKAEKPPATAGSS
ncbi:leucine-rich repeat-containing protein 51-like [Pseudoliparis swirei]|uniref:leucine-rich repeat-containing protein 51-like n=1 Tax=Pseudoliparis swirei TaxID=2059687 RepID=UPI0024BE74AF|nr:leucine-rich repeat-containing protein 51-like [Pseudoliparis swirei]